MLQTANRSIRSALFSTSLLRRQTGSLALRQPLWHNKVADVNPHQGKVQAWVSDFQTGQRQAIVELDGAVFNVPVRRDILHQVVVWQLAKRRAGTASTRTRAEVRGGGRKPWPQKGTGRARTGSLRSPTFVGGGVAHGPKPRSYEYHLPMKTRRHGLRSALSAKYAQGDLHIVESIDVQSRLTKDLFEIINRESWNDGVLLVCQGDTVPSNLRAASARIKCCTVLPSSGVNVYDILRAKHVVFAVDAVERVSHQLTKTRLRGTVRLEEDERPGPLVDAHGKLIHYPGVTKLNVRI